MKKEEILEKILALSDAMDSLPGLPEHTEHRQRLEEERQVLIERLNRPPGNPIGNAWALEPYRFKPVNPDKPLTQRRTIRITDAQFRAWQSSEEARERATQAFREILEAYSEK
mgnify:CR=1 FL=1